MKTFVFCFYYIVILKHLTKEEALAIKSNFVVDVYTKLTANKNVCLPLCILLGIKYFTYKGLKARKRMQLNSWITETNKFEKIMIDINKICKQAKVKYENGCSINDIYKFYGCRTIKDLYSIYVYTDLRNPKHRIAPYNIPGSKVKVINIFLLDKSHHFVLITDIKKFFGTNSYCERCNIPHNNNISHKCDNMCTLCYNNNNNECSFEKDIGCEKCNRVFKNDKCFSNHKRIKLSVVQKGNLDTQKETVCDLLQICKRCNTFCSQLQKTFI